MSLLPSAGTKGVNPDTWLIYEIIKELIKILQKGKRNNSEGEQTPPPTVTKWASNSSPLKVSTNLNETVKHQFHTNYFQGLGINKQRQIKLLRSIVYD